MKMKSPIILVIFYKFNKNVNYLSISEFFIDSLSKDEPGWGFISTLLNGRIILPEFNYNNKIFSKQKLCL